MDLTTIYEASWRTYPALLIVGLGGALLAFGLWHAVAGSHGRLRERGGVLTWVEGFRLAVIGLALIGGGLGWLWQVSWLLFLALGIGAVESLESSVIIAAMRRRPRPWRPAGGA